VSLEHLDLWVYLEYRVVKELLDLKVQLDLLEI